jgi:hypothetical protein
MSGGGSAYAKYFSTKTQSQANTNNCNAGTDCSITSPLTQGDGSTSSPINMQISKSNEQDQGQGQEQIPPPGIQPIRGFEQVLVVKLVTCPTGFVCPRPSDTIISVAHNLGNPSEFKLVNTLVFHAENQRFGNLIALRPENNTVNTFEVTELIVPPTPPGLVLVKHNPGPSCFGPIQDRGVDFCTFVDEYRVAPTASSH